MPSFQCNCEIANNEILLETVNLQKKFIIKDAFFWGKNKTLMAVDDVSIIIKNGQTLGLVGESGCGKSTLGKMILRAEQPTEGKIIFNGQEITYLKGEKLRNIRRNIQGIFQDADASLNPRMKIERIIQEPLLNFRVGSKAQQRKNIIELLQTVGLPEFVLNRYPHQLSGGQKQRVAIARALTLKPKLILCDEVTASLDVSIQAQVLNLLKKFKDDFGLSYLFISHDIAAVKYISDEIAVMYLGKIVEVIKSENLVKKAQHPYTQALLKAIPIAEGDKALLKRQQLMGEPPNPMGIGRGCRFRTRCHCAEKICDSEEPKLKKISSDHQVACHFVKMQGSSDDHKNNK
ncbi:oligopeptide/dipeptide ABC transporter ATP-binding protein [Proteinivorax tanatarense]|uniref:Oligopeptide/dipeptide ABC transporter ATP-binding protein n=1 Tax=Proteinivorax tanatarense TaxID=1260629 RepID=A0AAU7VN82_9FIRM